MNKKFWYEKKILITGHQGFLGSWMTKFLVEAGAEVVGLDISSQRPHSILEDVKLKYISLKGNVANLRLIREIADKHHPEYIFHLAADAIVGTANKQPVKTFKSNIEGTWNVLEVARKMKSPPHIVVASSDKAYGSHKKLPYSEEAPLIGEHPYDVSKSCADLICRSYAISFGSSVCVTRCGNIYGPGDLNFSRLIPDAIRHLIVGQQFIIRSDGTFTRDYIYVMDIVDAYLTLAQYMAENPKVKGEAFNFSYEQPLTVLDLYKRIYKACSLSYQEPKIENSAKHEIRHQYLSASKARKMLGWKPHFTIDKGLKETYSWYIDRIKR